MEEISTEVSENMNGHNSPLDNASSVKHTSSVQEELIEQSDPVSNGQEEMNMNGHNSPLGNASSGKNTPSVQEKISEQSDPLSNGQEEMNSHNSPLGSYNVSPGKHTPSAQEELIKQSDPVSYAYGQEKITENSVSNTLRIDQNENNDDNSQKEIAQCSIPDHIPMEDNTNYDENETNMHNISYCCKHPQITNIYCHTGNVMHWNSVKKNPRFNSTQELSSCLTHLVRCWMKKYNEENLSDVDKIYRNRLLIECPEHNDTPKECEVPDLRLSAKLYLKTINPEDIRVAILKTLEFARMDYIETLVIAFPPDELERDLITGEKMRPIWSMLELLLWENKILRLGVCDFSYEQLRKLISLVHLQPQINQVNLAFSTTMPPELNAYAKERGIQLHTHNDMCEILMNETFKRIISEEFCPKCGKCEWKTPWTVRYHITVKSRAVVRSKGYIVGAELS